MITPSWLTSVPSNLGSASHGKLKADQWRVLGSVYFPISLICLWWSAEPRNARSVRCRKILDITISLLSAVSIATSRVTSPQHADLYLQHIQAYLTGIKELFPDFKFVLISTWHCTFETLQPGTFLVGFSIRTYDWITPAHLNKL